MSQVVVAQPFMGMISSQTGSWSESVYRMAWANTCWELYGISTEDEYPQSDMWYTINYGYSFFQGLQ